MNPQLDPQERPLTLKEACAVYGDTFTPATLRAEAERGRLEIFRLGKRNYTTLSSLREMVIQCQEEGRRQGSTSMKREANGLSETDRRLSARVALQQTLAGLKKPSGNISASDTRQSRQRRHSSRMS